MSMKRGTGPLDPAFPPFSLWTKQQTNTNSARKTYAYVRQYDEIPTWEAIRAAYGAGWYELRDSSTPAYHHTERRLAANAPRAAALVEATPTSIAQRNPVAAPTLDAAVFERLERRHRDELAALKNEFRERLDQLHGTLAQEQPTPLEIARQARELHTELAQVFGPVHEAPAPAPNPPKGVLEQLAELLEHADKLGPVAEVAAGLLERRKLGAKWQAVAQLASSRGLSPETVAGWVSDEPDPESGSEDD